VNPRYKEIAFKSAHALHGYLTALVIEEDIVLGLIMLLMFLLYEFVEWHIKKDKLYPEIREWLIGFTIGAITVLKIAI